jgi:hypothetical protein
MMSRGAFGRPFYSGQSIGRASVERRFLVELGRGECAGVRWQVQAGFEQWGLAVGAFADSDLRLPVAWCRLPWPGRYCLG